MRTPNLHAERSLLGTYWSDCRNRTCGVHNGTCTATFFDLVGQLLAAFGSGGFASIRHRR